MDSAITRRYFLPDGDARAKEMLNLVYQMPHLRSSLGTHRKSRGTWVENVDILNSWRVYDKSQSEPLATTRKATTTFAADHAVKPTQRSRIKEEPTTNNRGIESNERKVRHATREDSKAVEKQRPSSSETVRENSATRKDRHLPKSKPTTTRSEKVDKPDLQTSPERASREDTEALLSPKLMSSDRDRQEPTKSRKKTDKDKSKPDAINEQVARLRTTEPREEEYKKTKARNAESERLGSRTGRKETGAKTSKSFRADFPSRKLAETSLKHTNSKTATKRLVELEPDSPRDRDTGTEQPNTTTLELETRTRRREARAKDHGATTDLNERRLSTIIQAEKVYIYNSVESRVLRGALDN